MYGFWIDNFLTVFLLIFALVLLIAGIFTAYFGSGKSRWIGVSLWILGLVIGLVYGYMAYTNILFEVDLSAVLATAATILIAGILGALAAIGIFLVAIMKS